MITLTISPDRPDPQVVGEAVTLLRAGRVLGYATDTLYGLAVDGSDRVFVTGTDARNAENGLFGENLIDLDNRMFLNQVVRVNCAGAGCGSPTDFELEPLPPGQPLLSEALATPPAGANVTTTVPLAVSVAQD